MINEENQTQNQLNQTIQKRKWYLTIKIISCSEKRIDLITSKPFLITTRYDAIFGRLVRKMSGNFVFTSLQVNNEPQFERVFTDKNSKSQKRKAKLWKCFFLTYTLFNDVINPFSHPEKETKGSCPWGNYPTPSRKMWTPEPPPGRSGPSRPPLMHRNLHKTCIRSVSPSPRWRRPPAELADSGEVCSRSLSS